MDLNRFLILGITYEKFNLQERERFIQNSPQKILDTLYNEKKIKGYVFLPTCLRAEMYIELNNHTDQEEIYNRFEGVELSINKIGREAVYYFFQLVCGFHSIIKGEDQILSQIKMAFLDSQEFKHTSRVINIVFNKGIALGKEFRNLSQISTNGLSIEGLSVIFLEKTIGESLIDKNILVLGVGELAKSILRILKKIGCKNLAITNRTTHKAKEMTEKFGCKMVSFENKYSEIAKSDIIIAATSAPHFIIKEKELQESLMENKEYVFLDLAVPRDIEPSITSVKKDNENSNFEIKLFNLDNILKLYNRNKQNRELLVNEYLYLLDNKFEELKKSLNFKDNIIKKKIIIGTRGSKLALAQSEYIKSVIETTSPHLECDIKVIVTSGDKDLKSHYNNSDSSLKSFFTKEIEHELLEGKIDLAVHSMKDMPSISPPGLICGAIPIREDNRDVIISNSGLKLEELPQGSIMGTSSLRRTMGIQSLRDDIVIKPIRGNIHTRIKKLRDGEYDAIVLAAAGLKRVGFEDLITEYLEEEKLVPAPAQGALYIQCRENDSEVLNYLRKIHSHDIEKVVMIEREFSKIFDGGCHVAMGCSAKLHNDKIRMVGNYFHEGVEYKEIIEDDANKGIEIAQNMAMNIKRRIYEKR